MHSIGLLVNQLTQKSVGGVHLAGQSLEIEGNARQLGHNLGAGVRGDVVFVLLLNVPVAGSGVGLCNLGPELAVKLSETRSGRVGAPDLVRSLGVERVAVGLETLALERRQTVVVGVPVGVLVHFHGARGLFGSANVQVDSESCAHGCGGGGGGGGRIVADGGELKRLQ